METITPTGKPTLEIAEIELWQIVRMHSFDIKIACELTPDYGDVFYSCTMTVCEREFISSGRNLWKRYRYFTETLTRIYGENLYEYGKKPLHL